MSNVFTLFGELDMETGKFSQKAKAVDAQLKITDANLNKVIAASNRLGDTSATVARRYEKVSDGLALQNTRLKEASTAFASGDINANKYKSTLASVETQTRSLASRIADAKARVQELNDTSLTHFQQQIAGAVDATGRGHSMINLQGARPLQGLGPVLQGLGLRQYGLDETILNILLVAAREAGIIKFAAEGTAAATTVAAAAESKFASSAATAAGSAAATAAASEATAVATEAAAGSMTIFGATLTTIGAALIAAVAVIGGAYKLSKDIRVEAEKRLKYEEGIAGALNQQYLALKQLNNERSGAQSGREFSRFVQGDDIVGLKMAQANIQNQYNETAQKIIRDVNAAAALNESIGATGVGANARVIAANPTLNAKGEYDPNSPVSKAQEELANKLKELDARIDAIKNSGASSADLISDFQRRQLDAVKAAAQAEKEFADARKKAIEESIRKAKEYAAEVLKAQKAVADAQKAVADTQKKIIQESITSSQHRVEAAGLRGEADQLRSGVRDDPGDIALFQKRIQDKIDAATTGGSFGRPGQSFINTFGYAGYDPGVKDTSSLEEKIARDKQLASILQVGDIGKLTDEQRRLGASARDRLISEQAEFDKKNRDDSVKALRDNTEALNKFQTNLVVIKNEAPNSASVVRQGTPADVNARYPQ